MPSLFQQKKNYYDMEDEFFFVEWIKICYITVYRMEIQGQKVDIPFYEENLLRYWF